MLIVLAVDVVAGKDVGDDRVCAMGGGAVDSGMGCYYTVEFENSCEDVMKEIEARLNGQKSGEWADPHNGTYSMMSKSTNLLEIEHIDVNYKYDDFIDLAFTSQDGEGCKMAGCSESQVQNTHNNFCNIHDLYCTEEGCKPFNSALKYEEMTGTCNNQDDASQCV
tara:strand:- start:234 stop:728 length:495 start_codon:yes stop_codon:yes gene_type:complete